MGSQGSWFQHCVVRTAGLPWSCLDLGSRNAAKDADSVEKRRIESQRLSSLAGDALYDAIPGLTSRARRKALRLRRDLFNGRTPREGDLSCLKGAVLEAVEDAVSALSDLESRERSSDRAYANEAAAEGAAVLGLLENQDFASAIRLSSPSLANRLSPAGGGCRLASKVERSVLRYLTRAAAKATPFARFCAIIPGRFGDLDLPLLMAGSPSRKWSKFRLNKRILQYVLGHLSSCEEARRQLPVRLNPTLVSHETSHRCLSAQSGREGFQTITRNAAIDLVIDSLRTKGTSTIESLARALVTNVSVEASGDEAIAYLDHLMSLGLLQPDLPGLANRPDWTAPLTAVIATVEKSPIADNLQEFLRALDGALAEIESAPVGARNKPISNLERLIQDSFDQWYPVETPAPRPPLFEDASANCTLAIDRDHFGVALRELEELLTVLTPVAWMRREPLQLRRFFKDRFSAPSVPLLTFYEVYYREVVKPSHDPRTDPALAPDQAAADDPSPDQTETALLPPTAKRSAPPYPPEVQAIRNAHRRITELIGKRWKAAGRASEIFITREDIEAVSQGVAPRPADPMSFSVFACLVPRPGELEGGMIVAPGARGYSGFGKYFSRFLYLLPQGVLDDLRQQHDCGTGLVLAEIAGDQAFNANLRPPIRSTEISYPSGDRVGCDEAISVADLDVVPDQAGVRLDLVHRPSGRRVLPVDLCFMNPAARPPLYRLLRAFSPVSEAHLDIPWRSVEDAEPEDGVLQRPRIIFGKTVVIARHAWVVKLSALPRREEVGASGYFRRLRRFRTHHDLPEQAYARAIEWPWREAKGDRFGLGDLRRPQYIDFRSPLLVDLLEHYQSLGPDRALVFEECLPDSDQLPRDASGLSWVTEAILQVDVPYNSPAPRHAHSEMAHA